MKTKIKGFWQVFQREVKLIVKDLDLLTIILLSPLFYSLFYGSVYLHKTESEVPIVIVDRDHSAFSRQLIRYLDAHQMLKVAGIETDLEQAKIRLNSWHAQAIIRIPADFERNLKRGGKTDLKIYLNTSRFLPANDINRAVQEVTATMEAGIRLRYFQSRGLNFGQALQQIEPLRVDDRNLFNTRQSYGDFLIPGILALILQQTLLFGLAMSVAKESELNSWHELFSGANGSIWAVIGGKSFVYLALYIAYAAFFFIVDYALLNIPFRGNYLTFLLFSALFLVSVTYLSFFIGTLFQRKIIALQFLVFISYPVFLLSGFSWRLQSMPRALQWIANLMPTTPYLQGMTRITAMGAGWSQILPEFLHLLTLTVLGLILTRLRLKQLLNKTLNASISSPLLNWYNGFKKLLFGVD